MTPHERHIKRLYGITADQYNELYERQGGCCPICQRHSSSFKTRLAVDHNHNTGEVRGLLCSYCNHRLVGRHRDSGVLRRIADYLDGGTGWYVPQRINRRRRRKDRNIERTEANG